ncbi:hypothetical protein DRQ29_01900 [bacterium]|nr:MAG: hypothetical protein DRQ29_01900 [bacterium]
MLYFLQIVLLLVLLGFSAIFSGSETAFFSISPIHRARMRYRGDKSSKRTLKLLEKPSELLAEILSGNMIVNIAATAFTTSFLARHFPGKGAAYAIPVMTILLLLFGEITPKVIAARWNMIFSRTTNSILIFLMHILYPFIFVLSKLGSLVGANKFVREELTEADFKAMVDILRRSENWSPELITGLLGTIELDKIPITDFAIPRERWLVANFDAPAGELRRKFDSASQSVIVLFDENAIAGLIEPNDLLGIPDDVPAGEKSIPPVMVDYKTSVSELLSTLMRTGIRSAIILDENEKPIGLVEIKKILYALLSKEIINKIL